MNEELLDTLPFFDLTPDLVFIASKEGYFKKINKAAMKKLGYSHEELFSRLIASFIHPDDRPLTAATRKEMIDGKPLINFQNRYITKSGAIIWLDWTSIYFPDQEIVFAIAKDVTERKKIEADIEEKYMKFKGLAAHFKNSIEKDRKDFAYELHEELAQLAAVIKMDIDWINQNAGDMSKFVKGRIDHALAVSAMLIQSIRKISLTTSPYMLDKLGLDETLTWLCNEFTVMNKVACKFESQYDEKLISEEVRVDLFRICQEALNNIASHAGATKVTIRIREKNGRLELSVKDNGKGFNPDEERITYGLVNIRERAASINGELEIKSEVGKGTTILVTVAMN